MKHNYLTIVLTILMSMAASVASAHDFEVDGIYYRIISSSSPYKVAVTYQGSSYYSYDNEYTGSVNIPESVTYNSRTYSVTTIDNYAFRGCSSLTSITIPNSVTTIDYAAFYGCEGLTSVTIPNSVTSIGSDAFWDCSGLTSVTIGNSVTSIGSYAFYECSSLTSVTIGNSVTSIGDYAFYYCSGLTSVTIPNSVTSIGSNAFYGCGGLTSVYNTHVFAYLNTNYEGIYEIPYGIKSISSGAFCDCSGLTSVIIPNSVTNIGRGAFYNTAWYNNQPDGIVYAGKFAYKYKGTMPEGTSIVLEEGTLGIADWAFWDCSGLASVTIPNSVTSIGSDAFWDCSGLTSITIPNSVTSIGDHAFSGCNGIKTITIGTGVKKIGHQAFYPGTRNSNNLESIIVEKGNITYDSRNNCNAIIETGSNTLINGCKNTIIPSDVTIIGDCAFYGCTKLNSINIPSSVISIGIGSFQGCSALQSITIPNSVTSIGSNKRIADVYFGTFNSCTNLRSITIGNNVTTIGQFAFSECSNLTSIKIPDNVSLIDHGCFYGCSSLNSITIGDGIRNIEYIAFGKCSNLKDVYCNAPNVPFTDKNAFMDSNVEYATLHVPQESVDAYKAASPWKDFGTITQQDDGGTSIETGRFYLQNIASGKYWGAGNAWGTQATLVKHPEFVTLATLSDGLYTIESQVNNGIQDWYFNGEYMDGGINVAAHVSIKEISNGVYTIANDSAYYGWDGKNSAISKTLSDGTSENAQWYIIPEHKMHSNLNNATCNNPIDATFLIQDPGLGRNNRYYSAWKWEFPGAISHENNGPSENFCVESYHVPFRFSQTLNNVPNGVYELTAQGFYRQDGSDSKHLPYLFINDGTQQLSKNLYSEYSLSMASQSFSNGHYKTEPIFVKVSNNTITLGVELKENTKLWCVWDNFELKYYGDTEVDSVLNIKNIPGKITMSGEYDTFCSTQALDFSGVDGLKAYIASVFDTQTGELTLTRVKNVKAQTGLVLCGTTGKTYEIPEGSGSSVVANLLIGVTEGIDLYPNEGGFTNFILSLDDRTEPIFHSVLSRIALKAGKAYLKLPTAELTSEIKSFRIIFDEGKDESDISLAQGSETKVESIYDLSGRQQGKMKRGVNLLRMSDGTTKKVLVK